MEAEKERTVTTIFKHIVKFGVSTVLGNLMMVGMPANLHWLIKGVVGIGTGVITMMICDTVDGYIDKEIENAKAEILELKESFKSPTLVE